LKNIYERIARWLDVDSRYINLIGRNSPGMKKSKSIDQNEKTHVGNNMYRELKVKWNQII
jgi:hypothetical protein